MTANDSHPRLRLFSVGHSNHDAQKFINLLRMHDIEVVADVRSQPYSKYTDHFNCEPLKRTLADARIQYVFLGIELGGRPDGAEYYDSDGHVLYDRLASSPLFLEGIERLVKGIRTHRVAMMCSEEDPTQCHRHLLVTQQLTGRGVEVLHIRGDGRVQTEEDLRHERTGGQQFLFEEMEQPTPRSIRPVSPKRPAITAGD